MRLDAGQIEVMDEAMVEVLRAKTPFERLDIANGMWRCARDLICDQLQQDHPDWTPQEIQKETARRLSHGAV